MIYDHLKALGKKHKNISFVQIGANDGITNDPLYGFTSRYRWNGVVVEPVKPIFERLKNNYRQLPVEPIMVAVHASETSMPFHYLQSTPEFQLPPYADGVGSFNPRRPIIVTKELKVPETLVKTIDVPCKRLEQIVADSKLSKVDLLVVDAEGYDNEILAQALPDEWQTHTIIFEHYHIPKDALDATLSRLSKMGFQFQRDRFDILATRTLK